jgi:toxin FitB
VVRWRDGVDGDELFSSVLVVGEIRQGIERLRGRGDVRQAAVFERWLGTLTSEFDDRILPVTTPVAGAWGRLNAADPLPLVDGLLAATALVHGLTLVTRETARLERTGISLLNPWGA